MVTLGKCLVTIFFVVIVFWLSVFNRDAVDFTVYPVMDGTQFPLALIILGAVLLGFIWGALIVWFNGGVARGEARRLKREVKVLEKENQKKEIII